MLNFVRNFNPSVPAVIFVKIFSASSSCYFLQGKIPLFHGNHSKLTFLMDLQSLKKCNEFLHNFKALLTMIAHLAV